CAVTVNPAPAPGENLLTNGDFSNGLTGWLFAANGTTSSASVSNGEAVISITTAGTNAWEPQFVKDGFALVSGQQYTVSFQARAAANRNIQLFVNTGPNNYASFFTQSVPLTTTMQTFTYTFTANANDDNARIDFNCGGNTANVIID
ncbi:carbohydrate binding domain-containing protein, partial [Desulfonatronum sp. SC1]|uniref:carbohydrate binding domain-containing protein n=1 Tax=Desulfonatronum sp. SC1 TaxID=2109626 RepID=UPI000D48C7F7